MILRIQFEDKKDPFLGLDRSCEEKIPHYEGYDYFERVVVSIIQRFSHCLRGSCFFLSLQSWYDPQVSSRHFQHFFNFQVPSFCNSYCGTR